jgi:hypothetical protein
LEAFEQEEKARVRFQNLESPGVPLEFNFQSLKNYTLLDGMEYDLPVSVIDHLNNDCKVPIYKMYDPDEVQKGFNPEPVDPNTRIIGYKNRFSLIPISIAPQKVTPKKESEQAA